MSATRIVERDLTDDEKLQVLEDFEKWSGGFLPEECDRRERRRFIEFAMVFPFRGPELRLAAVRLIMNG